MPTTFDCSCVCRRRVDFSIRGGSHERPICLDDRGSHIIDGRPRSATRAAGSHVISAAAKRRTRRGDGHDDDFVDGHMHDAAAVGTTKASLASFQACRRFAAAFTRSTFRTLSRRARHNIGRRHDCFDAATAARLAYFWPARRRFRA